MEFAIGAVVDRRGGAVLEAPVVGRGRARAVPAGALVLVVEVLATDAVETRRTEEEEAAFNVVDERPALVVLPAVGAEIAVVVF